MKSDLGELIDTSKEKITIGGWRYLFQVELYYTGNHYNVYLQLHPDYDGFAIFSNHPGRSVGLSMRADNKEEIEEVTSSILDKLTEYLEGWHEVDNLSISITLNKE